MKDRCDLEGADVSVDTAAPPSVTIGLGVGVIRPRLVGPLPRNPTLPNAGQTPKLCRGSLWSPRSSGPPLLISRLVMVDSSTTYTSASGRWRRSGFVIIVSVHDTSIASFPIRFLQSSGDNTWSYVLHVVNLLIEVDSRYPGDIVDDHGNPVDPQDAPAAGVFRYIEQGASVSINYRRSAELHTIHQAKAAMSSLQRDPNISITTSLLPAWRKAPGPRHLSYPAAVLIRWVSSFMPGRFESHRAQLAFREELLARDGWCLLTNNLDPSGSDAAHVVPQSRPDVNAIARGYAWWLTGT